jgi:hypothetical protein
MDAPRLGNIHGLCLLASSPKGYVPLLLSLKFHLLFFEPELQTDHSPLGSLLLSLRSVDTNAGGVLYIIVPLRLIHYQLTQSPSNIYEYKDQKEKKLHPACDSLFHLVSSCLVSSDIIPRLPRSTNSPAEASFCSPLKTSHHYMSWKAINTQYSPPSNDSGTPERTTHLTHSIIAIGYQVHSIQDLSAHQSHQPVG